MYTLLYFKWITNKDLLYGTGHSAQCFVAAWRVRKSIPRQIDKKFRVPKEEKWVWCSQSGDWGSGILKEEKRTNFFFFFPSTILAAAATAKLPQSCPTLCDPTDSSPPGSPDPGILQARTLEWVAISFSNAWKWKVKVKSLSCVRLLATPWIAAYQAPPPMGFSRQEYWSGCHCLSLSQLHNSV